MTGAGYRGKAAGGAGLGAGAGGENPGAPVLRVVWACLLAVAVAGGGWGCALGGGGGRSFQLVHRQVPVAEGSGLLPLCDQSITYDVKNPVLMVFASAHCPPCREMLLELGTYRQVLAKENIRVLVYYIDVPRCIDAQIEAARSGGFPSGILSPSMTGALRLEETPVVHGVFGGQVVLTGVGAVPVPRLLESFRQAIRGSEGGGG